MEEHFVTFRNINKVELMGFLMSDMDTEYLDPNIATFAKNMFKRNKKIKRPIFYIFVFCILYFGHTSFKLETF